MLTKMCRKDHPEAGCSTVTIQNEVPEQTFPSRRSHPCCSTSFATLMIDFLENAELLRKYPTVLLSEYPTKSHFPHHRNHRYRVANVSLNLTPCVLEATKYSKRETKGLQYTVNDINTSKPTILRTTMFTRMLHCVHGEQRNIFIVRVQYLYVKFPQQPRSNSVVVITFPLQIGNRERSGVQSSLRVSFSQRE
jgi:hypothetical protein